MTGGHVRKGHAAPAPGRSTYPGAPATVSGWTAARQPYWEETQASPPRKTAWAGPQATQIKVPSQPLLQHSKGPKPEPFGQAPPEFLTHESGRNSKMMVITLSH